MNTVSIVGSVSRRAGGLFESVMRLHQELVAQSPGNQSSRLNVCAPACSEGGTAPNTDLSVRVLSLRDEFTEADLSVWEPISVHVFDCFAPRGFGYAPGLMRTLLALKPDLAHVHGLWQFNSVAALAWHQKTRKPYLVSPHGMLDPWALQNSRWRKALGWIAYERSHLKSAACIRALCDAEAAAVRRLGLTNPICVIPNGVDLPQAEKRDAIARNQPAASRSILADIHSGADYTEPSIRSWDCPFDRKVLLYLGRIHPKKGLGNLLKAWASLQSCEEWVLVIAGWDQGGHETELKRLASDLKIRWTDGRSGPQRRSSVFFAGPQFGQAKEDWLLRSDAFILPSFSEGIPMAVLEAWAHGKAVIMTPECNLPEAFSAGAALCIYAEPCAIADGLRQFFGLNRLARELMGLRGRALVSRRFAWPQIAAQLRAVYFWITGAGPKPGCVMTG